MYLNINKLTEGKLRTILNLIFGLVFLAWLSGCNGGSQEKEIAKTSYFYTGTITKEAEHLGDIRESKIAKIQVEWDYYGDGGKIDVLVFGEYLKGVALHDSLFQIGKQIAFYTTICTEWGGRGSASGPNSANIGIYVPRVAIDFEIKSGKNVKLL